MAGEQGDATSQFNLGSIYHNGDGIPRDTVEAAHWYRMAAEQGHANAQHNLGFMYAHTGIAWRLSKVMRWHNSISESGIT